MEQARSGDRALEAVGPQELLVVDDEELVLDLERRILEGAGYFVHGFLDGTAAVALFREQPEKIACVVLDLTLPGERGEDVLREIRRIRPDAPILVTTGLSEQEASDRLAGEGRIVFLQKPFLAAQLVEAVRGMV